MDVVHNIATPLLFLESRTPNIAQPPAKKTPLRKQLSPLRYPGGKSRVIDQIAAYLNRERLEQFVEVFAGGASLGLSLLDAGWIKVLHLNEYDPLVYNFWKTILTRPTDLIAMLQGPLPTLVGYSQAKERISHHYIYPAACNVEAAYDFLLLNRTSFAGILMANPIGGKNGSDEKMRVRWNPQTLTNRITRISEMSSSIVLTNEDAVFYLSHRTSMDNRRMTFFIDPPYTRVGKKLYTESFEGRHEELARTIKGFVTENSETDIVITYDDCPLVRNLYSDAEIRSLTTRWSIYRENQKTNVAS